MKLVKRLLDGSGNGEIVELDEQIRSVIQSKAFGIGAQGGEIFEAQVKIATCRNGEPVSKTGLKFIAARANQVCVKRIFAAGMGRGDYVSDAVGDGHFGHLHRDFQRLGPVVQAGKKVAMDIDHLFSKIAQDGGERKLRSKDGPFSQWMNRLKVRTPRTIAVKSEYFQFFEANMKYSIEANTRR